MARRAAYIDRLRREGEPLILVDAGNFFDPGDRLSRLVSVVAWKEMERLRYDAVTLGREELANWRLVQLLLAEDTLRVVTTNLERRVADGWSPVGQRWLVVERNGLRVGILGITMPSQVREWMLRLAGDSLRVESPVAAARRAIHDLRGQTDLTVVLLAGDEADLGDFAARVPEAEVIVGGAHRSRGPCGLQAGQSDRLAHAIVNAAGGAGTDVGLTRLTVVPPRRIVDYAVTRVLLRKGMPEDSVIARDVRSIVHEVRQMQEAHRQQVARGRRTE